MLMDAKILEFAGLLRKAGVKVSHSEVAECLKALSITGLEKKIFYDVMAATLIKDQADFRIFDKLFEYFFDADFFLHNERNLSLSPELPIKQCFQGGTPVPGTECTRSTGFGQGQGLATGAIDSFIQVIKTGRREEMKAMVREGIKSLGQIRRDDLENIQKAIRQVKVFLEWNMSVFRLEEMACDVEDSTWLIWQHRLAEMEEILYREMERTLIRELGEEALETLLIRENLNQMDFFRLTTPQVAEIRKKIGKLAHRLAARLSFRRKRAKRGLIDLPKTIRRSINTGGTPINPAYRNRYPTRPEFVILCDISGSVRVFSEFMLQLIYSIQNRFIHVRSFVFVDTPDEITKYFQNREIEDGIKDMYNKGRFSKTAFSDYGQMFIDFCEHYPMVLDKKTTLLVVGDARNNYNRDHADYFQKICAQVRRVIWLNPEPKEKWNQEDSIISVYGEYCNQVFECRNLQQLESVTRKILSGVHRSSDR